MQARMAQLQRAHTVQTEQRNFEHTLTQLCNELKERNILPRDAQICQTPRDWVQQFRNSTLELQRRLPVIMTYAIPVLLELKIPQCWVTGQFTEQGKNTLWDYIISLHDSAVAIEARARREEGQEAEERPAEDTETDTQAMFRKQLDAFPQVKAFVESIAMAPGFQDLSLENMEDPETRKQLTEHVVKGFMQNFHHLPLNDVPRMMQDMGPLFDLFRGANLGNA